MNARVRCLITASGALLLLCARQVPAHAGAWSAPVGAGTTILGYGEQYAGRTHRGVDISAAAASEVGSPAAGVVVFAGSVPADGGGVCGAVTVELPDGLKVSLLPLEAVFVSTGQTVAGGETVGLVAAAGDDSSAAAHLHLGLRRGDAYLDPAGYLPACSAPEVSAETEPASAPLPGMASGAVSGGAPVATTGAPSATNASASPVAWAAPTGDSLASAAAAVPVSRAMEVESRASSGSQVFVSAGLPVPSNLDPSRACVHARGSNGITLAPSAAPLGAGALGIIAVAAGCLLTPWKAVLARAN